MDKLNDTEKNRGFVTLEILIAMMIILLALGATMLVASGNDSILVDSQTNAEALTITQKTLENEQALARKDFKLVNSTTTTEITENTAYTKKVEVVTQPDFFTKRVTATISWPGTYGRSPKVTLTGLVTNFENAVGGSTCDSNLSGNWTTPQIKNTIDLAQIVGDPSGTYPITGLDAYLGKLYVIVNNTSVNTKPTFFVLNITNPTSPTYIGGIDNAGSVSTGLNSVLIATSSTDNYAYVANAYDANFNTCKAAPYNAPTPPNCAQLQILDITNSSSPIVKVNFEIPTSTPPYVLGNITPGSGQAVGKSIFYRNGYIYLGLSKTFSGPEFNIIDVHNPLTPHWVGSWPAAGISSGYAINAISVRGDYAYLATPNPQELIILDISNPSDPIQVGTYDAAGGSGNGKSISVIGDNVYLGRTLGGKEFYILNSPAFTPTLLGNQDINSSVNGLIVRDYLAFLLTNSQLQILNVGNPANISGYATPITLPNSSTGSAIDCEGNYIFVGSNDPSNKGFISVIAP